MKRNLKGDIYYYSHIKPKRKTPIAYSTKATSDFLGIIHEEYPNYTIQQLYNLITDDTKFILDPEAKNVLQKYIDFGEGNIIPRFKYI